MLRDVFRGDVVELRERGDVRVFFAEAFRVGHSPGVGPELCAHGLHGVEFAALLFTRLEWCVRRATFRGMSTLAEIEEAVETLPRPEQETLWQHLSQRLFASAGGAERRQAGPNLWTGARERLRGIWGDRVLSVSEVAGMRDYEDGE